MPVVYLVDSDAHPGSRAIFIDALRKAHPNVAIITQAQLDELSVDALNLPADALNAKWRARLPVATHLCITETPDFPSALLMLGQVMVLSLDPYATSDFGVTTIRRAIGQSLKEFVQVVVTTL
jgi:hypothetical protein